ncbi:MAG: GNAT family N-acetyltransferase [Gammaproteobacteria bacterium]|nr:GNAT family N-acetyltransferase [Gammaproteobacteria bacterium]
MTTGIDIQVVDWHQKLDTLKAIRKSVFIDEQHVPKDLEWDGQDNDCTHFLASINATPVATARLTAKGQIGRMAVLREYRGHGIGSSLLASVIEQAKQQGHRQVFLHAQVSVIGFYQKHGFRAEGGIFIDAGIEHRTMRLSLIDDGQA